MQCWARVGDGSIWDSFPRVPSIACFNKSRIPVPSGPVAPSIVLGAVNIWPARRHGSAMASCELTTWVNTRALLPPLWEGFALLGASTAEAADPGLPRRAGDSNL
jgi:hypothetical protein